MTAGLVHRDVALVGRDNELAIASGALVRGGCVIAGASGVGKSRLAAEIAQQDPSPVVRVVATAAAATVPLGAFGHLLTGVADRVQGPIASCLAALRERSPNAPPTLLIDDIHLLDDASAALVLAVCESRTARVVATLRNAERLPDAVIALWKESWLERLDLEPLSRRELRALVELFLGGTADAEVHLSVFALTEGNPLYARELLIDAVRSGSLAGVGGMWRWTGRPPQMLRLRDLIAPRTHDLTPPARDALELLAVGAPLRLSELATLTNDNAIAELERAGLASVRGGSDAALVELAHPVFGEVVQAALPAATVRRHRRRLAEVIGAAVSGGPVDVLRIASLMLESGEVDPELFLRASAVALRLEAGVPGPGWDGNPGLAVRLADAAGPGLAAGVLAAKGRIAISRFAQAGERLAPLEDEAAGAPFEQAAGYLRTRVNALHWSGATDDALSLLERAASWRDEADWGVLRATLRGWILHDRGALRTAAEELGPLVHGPGLAPQIRLDALVLLAMLTSRIGLIDECEALEPSIVLLVDELERGSWQTGWARYCVDAMGRAEAARDLPATAARLRAARDRAEAGRQTALAGGLAMALGRIALSRGHATNAIALLEDAVATLITGDPRNGLGWALTHLTRAHALSGDVEAAREALAQAERVAAERPSHLRLHQEIERARAWVEAARAKLGTAQALLLAVADDAREALAAEADALYDGLRFGAPAKPCAERLATLAGQSQSELLGAYAAHVAAVAAADAAAQMAAAERFAALELDLFAAEAAAGAARVLSRQGRESSARRAVALSAEYAVRCGRVRTPALAARQVAGRLTRREHEIATLAASGLSNAEIADELVLSVRSVETYVLRACRKLGIDRRTSLAAVLGVDNRN